MDPRESAAGERGAWEASDEELELSDEELDRDRTLPPGRRRGAACTAPSCGTFTHGCVPSCYSASQQDP